MRKATLVLECLLFLLVSYLLVAFGGTLLHSLGNGSDANKLDVASVFWIFAITPVCLWISLLFAIKQQIKAHQALYWPLVCMVLALLLMLHSWGMHAFMTASLIASMGSVFFAALGLWVTARARRCSSKLNPP
jgi:hypothetical protein